jgi:hypothetical protein
VVDALTGLEGSGEGVGDMRMPPFYEEQYTGNPSIVQTLFD